MLNAVKSKTCKLCNGKLFQEDFVQHVKRHDGLKLKFYTGKTTAHVDDKQDLVHHTIVCYRHSVGPVRHLNGSDELC